MQNTIKKIAVLSLSLLVASNSFAEPTTDSTAVLPPAVRSVSDTYMLANGRIKTTVGAYFVNINATNKRCPSTATPEFMTSIASVDVYGAAQAIEGVNNTLSLNPVHLYDYRRCQRTSQCRRA